MLINLKVLEGGRCTADNIRIHCVLQENTFDVYDSQFQDLWYVLERFVHLIMKRSHIGHHP